MCTNYEKHGQLFDKARLDVGVERYHVKRKNRLYLGVTGSIAAYKIASRGKYVDQTACRCACDHDAECDKFYSIRSAFETLTKT